MYIANYSLLHLIFFFLSYALYIPYKDSIVLHCSDISFKDNFSMGSTYFCEIQY